MVEKRRYKRVATGLDVLINGSLLAKGTNISIGGMYLHTGRSFALDSQLTLKFSVMQKDMTVAARVMNCQPSIGMGVSFDGLTYDQTHTLKRYVDESLQGRNSTDKKKVLLADNNAAQRRMNKSRLVLDGFTVYEAGSVEEAMRSLSEARPDVVVLEPCMEDLGGYSVLSGIKADHGLKDIPVVVLSARSAAADIERSMSLGAHSFLAKTTTSPIKLCMHVHNLLKK